MVDALIQGRAGRRSVEGALADCCTLSLPVERFAPILKGLLQVWGPQALQDNGARLSRGRRPS